MLHRLTTYDDDLLGPCCSASQMMTFWGVTSQPYRLADSHARRQRVNELHSNFSIVFKFKLSSKLSAAGVGLERASWGSREKYSAAAAPAGR